MPWRQIDAFVERRALFLPVGQVVSVPFAFRTVTSTRLRISVWGVPRRLFTISFHHPSLSFVVLVLSADTDAFPKTTHRWPTVSLDSPRIPLDDATERCTEGIFGQAKR